MTNETPNVELLRLKATKNGDLRKTMTPSKNIYKQQKQN